MRRLAITAALLALLVGTSGALGAGPQRPLSSGPEFLARYGLPVVKDVPIIRATPKGGFYPTRMPGAGADGEARIDHIAIRPGVEGRYLALVALHEWLHYVSYWRWYKVGPPSYAVDPATGTWMVHYAYEAQYASEDWLLLNEEALVEANAEALLPAWWRWLTGKRLGSCAPKIVRGVYVSGMCPASGYDTDPWRAWARKATGTPFRARANREWLAAALLANPDQRDALTAALK